MVGTMQQQPRRRAVALALALAFFSSGCAEEVALPNDADAELQSGADVFRARCSSCHGADGGGAIGPALVGIDGRLDEAQQRLVITEGRKAMPSFASTLSDADIDAIIRYMSEIL